MTKEEAIKDAQRLKQYFPYRLVGIIETAPNEWEAQARTTMSVFNSAARKGKAVLMLKAGAIIANDLTKQDALKQDTGFSVKQNENGEWVVCGNQSKYEYGVFPEKEGADKLLDEMEADKHIERLAASSVTADNFDDSQHYLCSGRNLTPMTIKLAEQLAARLGIEGTYPIVMFVGLVAFTLCTFKSEGTQAREGFLRSVVKNKNKLLASLASIDAGLPSLDFDDLPILSGVTDMTAASRIKASTETALIKGSESYQWFTYTGARPYSLDFRGKPVALKNGDEFGVRWSSNGKQRRLIIKSLGVSKVFTLTDADNTYLAKNSKEI